MKSIYRGTATKCVYCEKSEPTTRDHFFPKSKGGRIIVYACSECNYLKADLFPDEWIVKIKKMQHLGQAKRQRMIENTETLIYYLEDKSPKRRTEPVKVNESDIEIDLRRELLAKKFIEDRTQAAINNLSQAKVKTWPNSREAKCRCGVSKIVTQVNEYRMVRYWKEGNYLGSTNRLACSNCL